MCDEKLPFVCLAQELTNRKIPHSGLQVEANATSLVLKLLSLPHPATSGSEHRVSDMRRLSGFWKLDTFIFFVDESGSSCWKDCLECTSEAFDFRFCAIATQQKQSLETMVRGACVLRNSASEHSPSGTR